MLTTAHLATWMIAALSVLGVITRPKNWPEAWWAASGALALVLFSLIPIQAALAAVREGGDVYLFLTGMMVLAELARREGLFDWLASHALLHAKGSASRLFLLIYAVGTLVTIFLSNDATAVVLTPAVYATARRARVNAMPYLLICAFIANAASFVLPISNPANLVVFGDHMPTLMKWLMRFGAASVVSIVATYGLLRFTQRHQLGAAVSQPGSLMPLSLEGRIAAGSIALTAVILLAASTFGWPLGLPTCLAGLGAWLLISALKHESPLPALRRISWGFLPLVAALFVLVRGVEGTGVFTPLTQFAAQNAQRTPALAALLGAGLVALGSNLINNLPMGLIVATLTHGAALSVQITGALLIGVDLGPNLSVTGSLATLLWLVAIRREGEDVSAGRFLALGTLIMPPTLFAAVATLVALGR